VCRAHSIAIPLIFGDLAGIAHPELALGGSAHALATTARILRQLGRGAQLACQQLSDDDA